MRREATAEASLARRRDLRKLGTAIDATIKITATTRSSSIRENPLWFRINPPQVGVLWKDAARERLGRQRFFQAEVYHRVEVILFRPDLTDKVILLSGPGVVGTARTRPSPSDVRQ